MSWNERFSGPDFLFGTEPADFVRRQAWRLAPGARVLSLAEGEGRNAVYLAGQGLRVTAFESSPNALAKARDLAQARGVSVDWRAADLASVDWPEAQFDAVLACFIQFADPAFRARIFDGAARALRAGGLMLIHGFATRQPGYGSGGPGNVAHLYTLDLLREAFPGWPILHQADYDAILDEGVGHAGRAALVDFIASKP
ncbi:class I SAM-dependent methyltransferase [Sedimentimonas flavescens]|uniref:Class I SAM-dependent methyltransferase n=1 Tax=Sedimentimonas flavescens TaxID=2851012 RepID=A0ABT3A0U7_9RHOB|nr:class I SAM-dependent methyltransferase [Sedimentimonas flavescens]MCT2539091.1 class I SAM-dependent methyltransferase [Sedimentimonas flavescens]MCV2879467.1 class I SAM-dependent methyltransferase [Sedimentimonas flavescens]WBL32363.1 class I SAM-dependent methyltransferase [Sinirhodobacter sp. HNIBRBA609]